MSENDRNLNLERVLSIILRMKTKLPETIFFEDELNDEFSTATIQAKKIDKNYRYLHKTIFGEILHFLCYRVIATPIAKIYLKAKFHHKIVGKEKMKEVKDTGYFLYGNHTQQMADALIPSFVAFPKGVYVIVHPNNVSMKVFGKVTPYLGALPLPDDLGAMKNFLKAIEKRLNQKKGYLHLSRSSYLALLHEDSTVHGEVFPLSCEISKTDVMFHQHIKKKKKW